MLAFNNQFFSTHYSNEITDIKVYDVIALGDDAFLGDISFTQTATNENGSRSSNCNYQIYFIRKNGAWKATRIYNISTDSSDGTSDPASSSAAEASASPSAETE
jgi:flagellar hook assembly protein FlgD